MSIFSGMELHRFIDGTCGLGGHAELVLGSVPTATVLGIDRDVASLRSASDRLQRYEPRLRLYRGNYSEMDTFAAAEGWHSVDGILLDIGVSSPQLDDAVRGFSYRFDGPLDMRMDQRSTVSAATILNTWTEEELAKMFWRFGEERKSRRVAREVVSRREQKAWERTGEFAEMLEDIVGRHHGGPPPATRCFQALRIAVNGELAELRMGLRKAVGLLRPGGRLAVISFHSLEDRIVKHFFRDEAASCVCPPSSPICTCDKVPTLRVMTRKPVTAGEAELAVNRRAAPAKLRAAERLGDDVEKKNRA